MFVQFPSAGYMVEWPTVFLILLDILCFGAIDPMVEDASITGIIAGVVYNPPDNSAQDQRDLTAYLVETLDSVRNKYPGCGVALLGTLTT